MTFLLTISSILTSRLFIVDSTWRHAINRAMCYAIFLFPSLSRANSSCSRRCFV